MSRAETGITLCTYLIRLLNLPFWPWAVLTRLTDSLYVAVVARCPGPNGIGSMYPK